MPVEHTPASLTIFNLVIKDEDLHPVELKWLSTLKDREDMGWEADSEESVNDTEADGIE